MLQLLSTPVLFLCFNQICLYLDILLSQPWCVLSHLLVLQYDLLVCLFSLSLSKIHCNLETRRPDNRNCSLIVSIILHEQKQLFSGFFSLGMMLWENGLKRTGTRFCDSVSLHNVPLLFCLKKGTSWWLWFHCV